MLFSRAQNPLRALPVEILCHIFDKMEMNDLLACSLVAKHLRKVIVESSRLQYIIELARHCAVSVLPASSLVPFSTRLKLIRERERGWKYLDWKRKHTLKLPPTGSVYEFVGGLYANGRENVSRITASISFLELPSTGHDPETPLQTWTHAMEDINIIDFTMDPSQDLLVLVALAPAESPFVYELHLRSIKANCPHPNAPISVLSCWKKPSPTQPSSDVFAAVRIQISGCLVALLIKEVQEVGAHLEIWNWECSSPSSSSMTRNSGIDDFTFLTQDSFLLVRPAGLFEVYTFTDPAKDTSAPQLRITYAFPPLSDGYMYWYISMSSNPAPGYVPRPPTNPDNITLSNDGQIYYPHPEERIHACCLYIFEPHMDNMQVHSFVFFLNLRTLLNPAEEWLDKARALALERRRRREQLAAKFPPGANGMSSAPSLSNPLPPQPPFAIPYVPAHLQANTPQYPPFPSYSSNVTSASSSTAAPTISADSTTTTPHTSPTSPRTHARRHGSSSTATATATASSASASTFTSSNSNTNTIAPCQCHPNAAPRRPIERVPPNTVIPWEIWGPTSTRWFEECINTDWQHAIYGLRTVESVQRTPAFGAKIPEESVPREVRGEAEEATETEDRPVASGSGNGGANKAQENEAGEPRGEGSSGGMESGSAPSISGNASAPSSDSQAEDAADSTGTASTTGATTTTTTNASTSTTETMRYLRVRDFNPYIFTKDAGCVIDVPSQGKKFWVEPRLVTESSLTPSKGVFQRDIQSSLPYMEVISREMFEVTDVMMDDCRMLLLKRGASGKLERVDVLMM